MMNMPLPEHANAMKIAVLEEQIVGLREQQRAHNAAAQKRFDGMEKKLDELTAIMNRGKGAYAASMALAAGHRGHFNPDCQYGNSVPSFKIGSL